LLDSNPVFREMIEKKDWNTFWTGCILAAVKEDKANKYYYCNHFLFTFRVIGIDDYETAKQALLNISKADV
jgi:hypothetical protein